MTGQRPLLLVVDDEQGILDVVGGSRGAPASTSWHVREDRRR